jgi:hypothetical protein
MKTDVFISHASEDKDEIARPLAQELRRRGLTVWYDELALELGDGLGQSIDAALSRCRFGVVIMSHSFFSKSWPRRELDGLVAREVIEGRKVILPVWHRITDVDVARYSPTLAGVKAVSTAEGVVAVADRIVAALVPGLEPALFEAATIGDTETVSHLLSSGVNVDARNSSYATPLHVAAMRGNTKVAEALIRCGADVNAEDRDSWTPLHVACSFGHVDVVRLLVDNGADVNADRHVTGMRPYDMVNMSPRSVTTAKEISAILRAAGGESRWSQHTPGRPVDIQRLLPPSP